MPPEMLQTLPGYGPDVAKNRAEARKIMEKLGYGPDKRLAIKLSTRNFPGLARLRGDPDLALEGNLYRRRARISSTPRFGIQRWRAKTTPSARCR